MAEDIKKIRDYNDVERPLEHMIHHPNPETYAFPRLDSAKFRNYLGLARTSHEVLTVSVGGEKRRVLVSRISLTGYPMSSPVPIGYVTDIPSGELVKVLEGVATEEARRTQGLTELLAEKPLKLIKEESLEGPFRMRSEDKFK
ncbi:hypothetical protein COU61_02170 [Candidatus Pacearchaeota archaeon CG10_big_fil_rev_8_21_14_0_10_35_13]|nr:MAG: hypothetical protein COU61_02170 [Candidatus Pacearchaeota archaeon CG10_big_fil_rev_8_21_14_0_10_35_13]